jgi:hypothetical protein
LFLSIPFGVWVLSRLGSPQFLARYFLPDVLIWTFLFAFAMRALFRSSASAEDEGSDGWRARALYAAPRAAATIIIVATLCQATIEAVRWTPDVTMAEWPVATHGIPIVVEDFWKFLPKSFYASPNEQYLYATDQDAALLPEALRGANNLEQYAAALRRQQYAFPIISTDELLDQYDEFLVLDCPDFLWYEANIANRADFECRPRSDAVPSDLRGNHPARLVHVSRKESGP